jgi:hypothetical protein
MSLDTTNWVKYPFSVDGVEFVSMLDPQGSFYSQVERLPAGVFISENKRMVSELIGNPALMTRSELVDELDKVNLHASQAILALA